ncbi:MAG: flippase-like domain-containing protein [Deltaproteobacteria bacterium]|nr:flippase-like domain-containing protein [Deltaproteobacteria bacterium]
MKNLKNKSMLLSYAFLVLGISLVIWLIKQLGPQEILYNLKILGWYFIPLICPSLLTFLLQTEAWNEFLKSVNYPLRFARLFMIKAAGEAVNNINPLNWGGGDPVRILLLKPWVPPTQGTASVVVDRTLTSIALVLFMLIGILIALVDFDFPLNVKAGLSGSVLLMLGLTYYFYHQQHQGLFSFLIRLLQKLKLKKNFSEKSLQQAEEVDGYISQFYKQHQGRFFLAVFYHFLTRFLGVMEIFLAAYFLGAPITFVGAYLMASVTAIAIMIFAFIPGAVGVMEGTYAATFHLLSLDPATGTSVQIFRRIRTLLWAGIGFAYISWQQRSVPKNNT